PPALCRWGQRFCTTAGALLCFAPAGLVPAERRLAADKPALHRAKLGGGGTPGSAWVVQKRRPHRGKLGGGPDSRNLTGRRSGSENCGAGTSRMGEFEDVGLTETWARRRAAASVPCRRTPARTPRDYFSGLRSSLLLLLSADSSRPLTLSRYCSGTLSALSYLFVSLPSWIWISLTLVLPSVTVPVTVITSEPSWCRVVKRSPLR